MKPKVIIAYVNTGDGATSFGKIEEQEFYDDVLSKVSTDIGIGVIIAKLADLEYKLEITVDAYNDRLYVFYPNK
jgi:hypothetical protein